MGGSGASSQHPGPGWRAALVLDKVKGMLPRLQLIWVDGGYAGEFVEWAAKVFSWVVEVVSKPKDTKGFVLLPHRWIVERTFAWLGRYRRLSKDYEFHPKTSEAMIHLAMIHIMTRRLARQGAC